MLYLTRKIGQAIVINDKIEVTVVEVKGKNVKLGIEFPKNASVLRKEIFDNVVAQNKEAAHVGVDGNLVDDDMSFFEMASQEAIGNIKKDES